MNSKTFVEVEHLLRDGDWFARIATAVFGHVDGRRAPDDPDRPKTVPWTASARPEEAIERAELRLAVINAVLALEEPFRTAVILRFLERRSFAEIGRISQASEDDVRAEVERGLAGARTALRTWDRLQ